MPTALPALYSHRQGAEYSPAMPPVADYSYCNTHMSNLIVFTQSFTLFAFSIIGINNFTVFCLFYCSTEQLQVAP
jgi:hypothetical protein